MERPHVVAIPYPAQGHVIPLMELSQCLVKKLGIRVTFVNTDYNHKRVMDALGQNNYMDGGDKIKLVSIPDGMEPGGDRNELGALSKAIIEVMPGKLEELIQNINNTVDDDDEKISCVIADGSMGWALSVAEKMKLRRAAFWPAAAGMLALLFSIPKLIEDGIIEDDGIPIRKQTIQLTPSMATMDNSDLAWTRIGDITAQKILFQYLVKNNDHLGKAERMICNSTYDAEAAALALIPGLVPIGPLLASNRIGGNSAGFFWPEDSSCLKWLDQQQPNSVIYVAFGSFTVFEEIQFQELALGLELTNRPFLWVVRPDINTDSKDAYPKGFLDRVATCGHIVGWAPQQKVLGHPSIACFLSHCGWNSTMEGVSNGMPFLCWPYFADQFLNESYICDIWKVGLRFDKNQNGIITRDEIKKKVDQVLGDDNIKASVMELKAKTLNSISENGRSNKNLKNFIEWIKA